MSASTTSRYKIIQVSGAGSGHANATQLAHIVSYTNVLPQTKIYESSCISLYFICAKLFILEAF